MASNSTTHSGGIGAFLSLDGVLLSETFVPALRTASAPQAFTMPGRAAVGAVDDSGEAVAARPGAHPAVARVKAITILAINGRAAR